MAWIISNLDESVTLQNFAIKFVNECRAETRDLIGGGDIHILVFCPTSFF